MDGLRPPASPVPVVRLANDAGAKVDAFLADEACLYANEPPDLALLLPAERTSLARHWSVSHRPNDPAAQGPPHGTVDRFGPRR